MDKLLSRTGRNQLSQHHILIDDIDLTMMDLLEGVLPNVARSG